MLKIRREQYDVFAKQATAVFRAKAIEHARRHWAEECAALGDDELGDVVLGVLARAREHGLTSEVNVLRLLNVVMALECAVEDLVREPWAGEILQNERLSASAKLDALERRCHERLEGGGPAES